jgi:transposase
MRGSDAMSGSMFSYVDAEARVPKDHPLRVVRRVVNAALVDLSPDFDRLYARLGRPSVPPERLLRALLLQAFYSVRSERQLMEQLDYNLLFRWFVGLGIDDPVWDVTVYTKNRDRLLEGEVAAKFLMAVLGRPEVKQLLSEEHFSVDGTLIKAWASLKGFRPKSLPPTGSGDGSGEPPAPGRNGSCDFHGERRTNETHASTTDPQAKLFRKGLGKEAKLSFMGHLLMENRNGLIVDFRVEEANGYAERRTAIAMLDAHATKDRRITVGGDAGYDTADFVRDCRAINVTPHIAQTRDIRRRSAIDARTTRHAGYLVSQRKRKLVEEIFGWMKTFGGFRHTRFKGRRRTQLAGTIVAAAYNLLRICRLLPAAA